MSSATFASIGLALLGMVASPLLTSIISRVKAIFGGRQGIPLLQPYYDLSKLFRKGVVYSTTTSWVFRAGPIVGIACALSTLFILPFGGIPGLFSFEGDWILFAGLFALMRFATILAALDTGSAFEGMGTSRELFFSALAEPALLMGLLAVVRETGELSLSTMLPSASITATGLLLVAASLFVVYLCENALIPFDDPETHLELTMIHEVMVLDHSGPDFALISWGASIKLWSLSALLTGLIFQSASLPVVAAIPIALLGQLMIAIMTGIIESIMARFRLLKVPEMLLAASALSLTAFLFSLR